MKANRRSFIQASAAIQAGAVLAASGMTSHHHTASMFSEAVWVFCIQIFQYSDFFIGKILHKFLV